MCGGERDGAGADEGGPRGAHEGTRVSGGLPSGSSGLSACSQASGRGRRCARAVCGVRGARWGAVDDEGRDQCRSCACERARGSCAGLVCVSGSRSLALCSIAASGREPTASSSSSRRHARLHRQLRAPSLVRDRDGLVLLVSLLATPANQSRTAQCSVPPCRPGFRGSSTRPSSSRPASSSAPSSSTGSQTTPSSGRAQKYTRPQSRPPSVRRSPLFAPVLWLTRDHEQATTRTSTTHRPSTAAPSAASPASPLARPSSSSSSTPSRASSLTAPPSVRPSSLLPPADP